MRAIDKHFARIPAADYQAACAYARRDRWNPLKPRDPLLVLADTRKGARQAGYRAQLYGQVLQQVVSPVNLPRDVVRVALRKAA